MISSRSILLLLASVFLAACSHRRVDVGAAPDAERTLRRMPRWYAEDGRDSTRLVAKATALSSDLQTALDIAKAEARADLLLQVESRTSAMTKRFREQTGAVQDPVLLSQFTAVSRDVAAMTLQGVRLREHEIQAEGALYRAYVALDLPSGAAARLLLDRLRGSEHLLTDQRAREAFEELSRELQRVDAGVTSTAPPAPRAP